MTRPRILFVQPSLQPPGGGNAVAVCALEALTKEFAVTVLAWDGVVLDPIRRDYGVELSAGDFELETVSRLWPTFLRLTGMRGALLQRFVLLRRARRIAHHFDAVVSFNNEIDAGDVPTVQYIHFPWGIWPRPEAELRSIHRIPGLLRAYYAVARSLAPVSPEQIAKNSTLVNSDWTGERFRKRYGGTTTTVYPPLMGTPAPRPWPDREDAIVALGVFARHKRLEQTVEIVERLRAGGRHVRLLIVGAPDPHDRASGPRVRALAAQRPWIELHENPSRDDLDQLLGRVRFGLHSMADEHFGMAVAEMTAAGCIPFVPRDGGQVEVVDDNERVLYGDVADAVTKISLVMDDPALQRSISDSLTDRSSRFGRERFADHICSVVRAAAVRPRDRAPSTRPLRIALAAGGTAGHVYPALAVAHDMKERGWDITFLGTAHGREGELIRRAGFEPVLLPGAPYHRTSRAGRLKALLTIPIAVASSLVLLARQRIDAVIGFGGYASIGPVIAARILRRWSAIVEPNAEVGKANRLLVRSVDRVYAAAVTSADGASATALLRTGIPARAEFSGGIAPPERTSRKRILVFGDEFLDAHVPALVDALTIGGTEVEVVHQGRPLTGHSASMMLRHCDHFDDVLCEYAAADLVISRAGAGTLNEIACVGRAALIVPLRTAAEDHQTRNAASWKDGAAALVIAEKEWDHNRVAEELAALLNDDAARTAMAARAHALFTPGATARLVDDVAACLERR